jgi:hypothetical protein
MYNKCHKAKHQNPIAKEMAQNRADGATGEAKQAETKHDEFIPLTKTKMIPTCWWTFSSETKPHTPNHMNNCSPIDVLSPVKFFS